MITIARFAAPQAHAPLVADVPARLRSTSQSGHHCDASGRTIGTACLSLRGGPPVGNKSSRESAKSCCSGRLFVLSLPDAVALCCVCLFLGGEI
jgi:hypothetical protein